MTRAPKTDRAREHRLRRAADRQGWRLRSRRGLFSLTDKADPRPSAEARLTAADVEVAPLADLIEERRSAHG